jgi:hypothetical protein
MKTLCHPMKTVGALVLGAFLLALVAGVGLVACEEEPVNVDPQAVLSTASANMKELAGFHFLYELHQPESADKAEGVQTVEGDIDAAGEMQATVQLLVGGVLINVDFVALGDTHYIRYPLQQEWTPMAPEESPLGDLNLAAFSIQILDQIVDPSYQGTGKKGGEKTYHMSGMVTAADVEQIAGSVSTADLFATDLWVGINDNLLYEVHITGPMTSKEADGTYRSIILSDLNVAVDIKAPQ